EPAGSRMRVVRLSGDRRLLDDCYNAGPQSMRAALEVLGASEGNTVAVLGDMAELGELTVRAHREMGALAKELGVGKVIAVGAKAKDIAEAAGGAWFATVDEAMGEIKAAFTVGTAMLVKASHSMHFEKITEELTKDK
ncbi:MAG: UDP-N-acetylmuramoyl-tripeptide--D-alanyl-D-alanine ligase, partial [Oscillospiraceae bacterium]|nr:UDP-N-acetylmuramoyl-tripeptide--D-alanyl-D-alanine ligase [Oscillospiraceae bacterium]